MEDERNVIVVGLRQTTVHIILSPTWSGSRFLSLFIDDFIFIKPAVSCHLHSKTNKSLQDTRKNGMKQNTKEKTCDERRTKVTKASSLGFGRVLFQIPNAFLFLIITKANKIITETSRGQSHKKISEHEIWLNLSFLEVIVINLFYTRK